MKAIYWRDETWAPNTKWKRFPLRLKKKLKLSTLSWSSPSRKTDDEMLHKFLEGEAISADELRARCARA